MRIVSYGGSYIGRRSNNEDSLGRTIPHDPLVLQDKGRLYLVCDGMGGTKGGEVASQLAIETIMDRYYAAEGDGQACLQCAIRAASAAIAAQAERDTGLSDMGSTVVALVVLRDRFIHAHVGDSRVYLLRDGKLVRLTRDHLHILDDLGVTEEEAETHPYKNILSRALGYLDASEPECGLMACRPGDRLLLCSDGLSDAVTTDDIYSAMQQSTPQFAVEMVLGIAESNDAHDNATALVVFVNRDDCKEEPTERIPLEMLDVLSSPDSELSPRIPVRRKITPTIVGPPAMERT
jgi:serine/threonine protein phosphatase PrpC